MQIQFIQQADVDIHAVPKEAMGGLQLRTVPTIPTFDPNAVEVTAVDTPTGGHFFPVGAIVAMPDDVAAGYVASGAAKPFENPRGKILWDVERPE